MTPTFNLLDEPWIPVRTHNGEVREVGLLDALLHAPDYAALAETSPPNLIALYRLLLAITHRALTTQHGPWLDTDRARWFREGLPEQALRDYLEHWRDRFWLFHPEHPFMQVAALERADKTKEKLKPWTQVALERSGGDTPLVFDRSLDSHPEPVPCALAIRSLLGYLQFTPGGLVKTFKTSDYAGPLASTAAIMPVGQSLAESLALSLHPFSRDAISDLPAWEVRSPLVNDILGPPTLPKGHNDRYTRLVRSVLFFAPDKPGLISRLRFSEGMAMEEDNRDPMVCCRVVEGEAKRVSFTEGRSLWRDLPSLVPDTTGRYDIQAASLGWATNLYEILNHYTGNVTVFAAGWKNAPNKAAKIVRWRLDQVELPQQILQDPENAGTLRLLVRQGEDLFFRLRGVCAEMVASTMPDPQQKDTRARSKAVLENGPTTVAFFSTTERALPKLLQQIASGDIDAAHRDWMAALKHAAVHAWEATRRSLGASAAVLRAEARTYPKFRGLLRTLEAGGISTIEETMP